MKAVIDRFKTAHALLRLIMAQGVKCKVLGIAFYPVYIMVLFYLIGILEEFENKKGVLL